MVRFFFSKGLFFSKLNIYREIFQIKQHSGVRLKLITAIHEDAVLSCASKTSEMNQRPN